MLDHDRILKVPLHRLENFGCSALCEVLRYVSAFLAYLHLGYLQLGQQVAATCLSFLANVQDSLMS